MPVVRRGLQAARQLWSYAALAFFFGSRNREYCFHEADYVMEVQSSTYLY